ncbi:MAG: tetratricopeptide repeat protein [Planctomycetia bacterium]|nr:tetratricopeptide repeat protein [Planctomycetia bacterium]
MLISKLNMSFSRFLLLICWVSMMTVSMPLYSQNDSNDLEVRPDDIIELSNGNRFVGEIILETNDFVKFETSGGSTKIQRADIVRIFYKNTPEVVYKKRLRSLDATDYESQVNLADWCLESGINLRDSAITHLQAAVYLNAAKTDALERLVPLYISREFLTVNSDSREVNLREECEILLRGIRAGVQIDGLDIRDNAIRSLIRVGDIQAAVLILEAIASGDRDLPNTISAMRRLVVLYDALGRQTDSRSMALQLREDGGGSDSEVLLREIRWAAEDEAAGIAGSADKLENLMEDLLVLGDADGKAYLYRGSVRLLNDDLKGAEADFSKAFAQGEVDAKAATTYALSFARKGDFTKALGLLSSVADSDTSPVDWRLVEAYVLESQGDIVAALNLYEEARLQPDAGWQAKLLAFSAKRRVDPDWDPVPAIQDLMQSDILSSAAFAECCLLLGDEFLQRGENANARRWLEYANASGLDTPELKSRLAMAQSGPGGNIDRARSLLSGVTELDKFNPDAWNAYARFLFSAKDYVGARDSLSTCIALFSSEEKESSALVMPPTLRWAMSALRQVERVLGEEYWSDDFVRESGSALRNNWSEEESFGINVSLVNGMVSFEGIQRFQPDRLTTIKREILTPRLSAIRSSLTLLKAGEGTRVALRIEDQSGGGVVFFRDPDGVLGFALLGNDEPMVVRTDSEDLAEEYDLIPTRWDVSPEGHSLEIAFSSRDSGGKGEAEIWFDGIRIAKDVPYRVSRKRGVQAGVSGQAPLDEAWNLQVEMFEVFRKRAKEVQDREF